MKNKFIIFIFVSSLLSIDKINCDVCLKPFSDLYLEDVWGNKYHKHHAKDGVFCETCSRLICKRITQGGFQFNDGRYMCNLCETNIVKTNQAKSYLLDSVLKDLHEKGITINRNQLEVNLIDKNSLRSVINSSLHDNKNVLKAITFIDKKKYIINILWGLNQLEFEGVLAHEILHTWIDYNSITLHNTNLEGFCNLGSMIIYNNKNTHLAKILLRSLQENDDSIYGDGYRHMNQILQKYGWSKLIHRLLNNNHNW